MLCKVCNKKIKPFNLTYKRPATGISPLHWDEVLGKKVNKSLNEDDILNWNDLV